MQIFIRITRDRDGAYAAASPALPDCVCRGRTPKEAVESYQSEVRRYVAAACDAYPDCLQFQVMRTPIETEQPN